MAPVHPDLKRTFVIVLLAAALASAPAGATADDSCFYRRGGLVAAHAGTAGVSGRLTAALQAGGWDTRPSVRVAALTFAGLIETGHWEAQWYVEDIHLEGATAIVAADFGLVSLDLKDPAHPTELDFIDLIGADHLVVIGGTAYVAADGPGGNGWFDVVDVSIPSSLVRLGGLYWNQPDPTWGKTAIDADGEIAVFACSAGLVVVDVLNPWQPSQRGFWMRDGLRDVALDGRFVAVAVASWTDPDDAGVEILDLSDPDAPTQVGHWQAPSGVMSVAEFGGRVLAGTEDDGLFLLDLTDPASPAVVDRWHETGRSVDHISTAWPNVVLSDLTHGVTSLGLDPDCLPPRQVSDRVGP